MSITVNGTTNVITGASGIEIVANTTNTGTLAVSGNVSGAAALNVTSGISTLATAEIANLTVTTAAALNGASLTTDDATFTAFAGATTLLTIGGTGASAVVATPGTLDATNSTTAALKTAGGLGVAKAAFIGTTLNVAGVATLASTTDATNSTTGGTVISGGAAVAKKVYVGTDAVVGRGFSVFGATLNTTQVAAITTAAPPTLSTTDLTTLTTAQCEALNTTLGNVNTIATALRNYGFIA